MFPAGAVAKTRFWSRNSVMGPMLDCPLRLAGRGMVHARSFVD